MDPQPDAIAGDDGPAATIGSPDITKGSKLDRLRTAFAEDRPVERLYKRFAPFGVEQLQLLGEYRCLSEEELGKIDATGSMVQASANTLTAALTGIYIRDPDDEQANADGLVELQAWAEQPGHLPLGFDARLVEILGMNAGADATPLEIILELYNAKEPAVIRKAQEVDEFMSAVEGRRLSDFGIGSE